MNTKSTLFDSLDPEREAEADRCAEADVRVGRLIGHDAVRRWLQSWSEGRPQPRPKAGD